MYKGGKRKRSRVTCVYTKERDLFFFVIGAKRRSFSIPFKHPVGGRPTRRRFEMKKALLVRVKLFEWKAAITYPPNG